MHDVAEVIPKGAFKPEAAVDSLLLDHDMRVRRRIVHLTAKGEEIRLNSISVVQLKDGDGLRLDDGRLVRVEAKAESLIEISAASTAAIVRIAWHLGNRHLPAQLVDRKLRLREDHVIADMVEKLGGKVKRISAPFDPEGGAYDGAAGHEPHHHHEDGHR